MLAVSQCVICTFSKDSHLWHSVHSSSKVPVFQLFRVPYWCHHFIPCCKRSGGDSTDNRSNTRVDYRHRPDTNGQSGGDDTSDNVFLPVELSQFVALKPSSRGNGKVLQPYFQCAAMKSPHQRATLLDSFFVEIMWRCLNYIILIYWWWNDAFWMFIPGMSRKQQIVDTYFAQIADTYPLKLLTWVRRWRATSSSPRPTSSAFRGRLWHPSNSCSTCWKKPVRPGMRLVSRSFAAVSWWRAALNWDSVLLILIVQRPV